MADFALQDVIDGLRSRLQAELDAQLAALSERHGEALTRAREDAEQAASERWTARLASEVEQVRAEAERRLVTETTRARVEAEQASAEAEARLEQRLAEERERAQQRLDQERVAAWSQVEQMLEAERAAAQARLDEERQAAEARLEQLLDAERSTVQARLEAEQARLEARFAEERHRLDAEWSAERDRAERALDEARAALEEERRRAEPLLDTLPPLDAGRLVQAMAGIDAARALSDVLALTAAAAALEAPRAALFVVNGSQLEEWHVAAVPALSTGTIREPEAGLLARALQAREAAHLPGGDAPAPGFARLPQGRGALAVPLLLDDQVVGAVYADEGQDGDAPEGWREAVEMLARHASARLAYLTAARIAQAVRLVRDGASGTPPATAAGRVDDQAARRHARLLVSEIKLYNEAAVRAGREQRDLRRRLRPEIDHAKRLYEERIPPSFAERDACFEQELVQTLADGDAALLG